MSRARLRRWAGAPGGAADPLIRVGVDISHGTLPIEHDDPAAGFPGGARSGRSVTTLRAPHRHPGTARRRGDSCVFHLWPDRLPGGFVGVDVFFVISGYLITVPPVLPRSSTRSPPARPVLGPPCPPSAPGAAAHAAGHRVAVMLSSPAAGGTSSSPSHRRRRATSRTGCWPLNAVDYLAADNPPSPAQHFWSFGRGAVLRRPALLLLCSGLVVGRRSGPCAAAAACVLIAVSLASSPTACT